MEIKHIIVPFELKAVTAEGDFEGFASTFGNIDHGDDMIVKGAFSEDLKEWASKKQLPLMAWQHDTRILVGDFLDMKEITEGLFVKGKIWLGDKAIDFSKMAHNLLVGTGPKAMSIGYSVIDSVEEVIDGVNVRKLLKIKLWEVSIVPFGMDPKALVTGAKSLLNDDGELKDIRSVEKYLRDGGLSSTQAKTLLSKGFSALNRDDDSEELNDSLKSLTHSILG